MATLRLIIKRSLLAGIYFYQKFISPYKGFHCAHSHYTGSLSCSNYGLKALNESASAVEALRLIYHRLHACSHINNLYKLQSQSLSALHRKQGGFIDGCDCSGCDMPDCSGCDLPSCNTTEVCSCASDASTHSSSGNCWEVLYFADGCSSCDPFYRANTTRSLDVKKTDSMIMPNFQLIDDLEDDYLLYKYNLNDSYYKIHKSSLNSSEENILNLDTPKQTWELSAEEVKEIFKNKKNK